MQGRIGVLGAINSFTEFELENGARAVLMDLKYEASVDSPNEHRGSNK